MVRPKLASDDEVLEAARQVMARRGPNGFTITEVAAEVGLSRAAIILRFKGTEELKAAMMSEMVAPLIRALDQVPDVPGGDSLLKVAESIGGHISSRAGSANYFSSYSRNMQDRKMIELERKRGAAMREAISRAMPKTLIEHDAAVALFRAHLSGSILSWHGESSADDAKTFLIARTQQWLKLAGIPFTEMPAAAAPNEVKAPKKPRKPAR